MFIFCKNNYLLVLSHIKRFCQMVDKSIWAYIGVSIAYFLYAQIPTLYVSTYLPKEQAALYFSAFTIASVIGLLINAQIQKIMPDLINNSIESIKVILKKNLKIMLIITISVFLFMLLFGKFLFISIIWTKLLWQCISNTFNTYVREYLCCRSCSIRSLYNCSGNKKRKFQAIRSYFFYNYWISYYA